MSGRAGYDIGESIGKLMQHKFVSTSAKIVSKIGQVVGMLLLIFGVLVMILDYGIDMFESEFVLLCFLIAVGGVALIPLLHWVALKIDKKHAAKE